MNLTTECVKTIAAIRANEQQHALLPCQKEVIRAFLRTQSSTFLSEIRNDYSGRQKDVVDAFVFQEAYKILLERAPPPPSQCCVLL